MATERTPPCPVILYYGVNESRVSVDHMVQPDPRRRCVWSFCDPATDVGRLSDCGADDPAPQTIKYLFVHDACDPDTCLLQLGPGLVHHHPYTIWFSTAAQLVSLLRRISEVETRVRNVHALLQSKGFEGNLNEEFVEQILAVLWLKKRKTGQRPCSRVLELGANIGRNSCVIASLLPPGGRLLSFETNAADAERTMSNLARCGFAGAAQVEGCAISSVPLQQTGWQTKPIALGRPEAGWAEVQTMTFSQVTAKHGPGFDTLVADCEGALFNILQDTPELLDTIQTIIVENDYEAIADYEFVAAAFEARGFGLCMQVANDDAHFPTKRFFYQVWMKHDRLQSAIEPEPLPLSRPVRYRDPTTTKFYIVWHILSQADSQSHIRKILERQLATLKRSGILEAPAFQRILIGYIGQSFLFEDMFADLEKIEFLAHSDRGYEGVTMMALKTRVTQTHAQEGEEYGEEDYGEEEGRGEELRRAQEVFFLYVHTRGASHPEHSPAWTWTRMMEHFMIERHQECRQALATHNTTGCALAPHNGVRKLPRRPWGMWHYPGNFWWARASYIRCLPWPLEVHTLKYENSEDWILHEANRMFPLHTFHCMHQPARRIDSYYEHYDDFATTTAPALPSPPPSLPPASPPASPSPRRRRAAVCMWGLLRGVRWTWESVEANIIRPLKELEFDVDIFVHTYSSREAYHNPWSRESAPDLLDMSSLEMVPHHTVIIEDKEAAVHKLRPLIELLRSKSPWFGNQQEPGLSASTNHILALHSLQRVTSEALQCGGGGGGGTEQPSANYSTLVFVRPDTLILDPLDSAIPKSDIESPGDFLYVPDNDKFDGFNDRFCLCGPTKARVYGSRILQLPALLSDPRRVANGNSERLLGAHLHGHRVREVPFVLRRVRIGGEMVDRSIGTLRIDLDRLFASVYPPSSPIPRPDTTFFDRAWTSRSRSHYGFPIHNVQPAGDAVDPGDSGDAVDSGTGTSGFALRESPSAGVPPSAPREWLEIEGKRRVVVVPQSAVSVPGIRWACGSLEVALLELGIRAKNLVHSDPRIIHVQNRFIGLASGFVFARSMAALANLVFSFQLRSFVCVGIPDMKSLKNASEPNTMEVCMMMALIYGLAVGRVYRPKSDEGLCVPRWVIRAQRRSAMLFTQDHVQSAYEIGMSLVVNAEDLGEADDELGEAEAEAKAVVPDVLFVGSAYRPQAAALPRARFTIGLQQCSAPSRRPPQPSPIIFENEDIFISQPGPQSS